MEILASHFKVVKLHSQHIALREVNSLETEMIDVVPHIDKVRVPVGPKGVNGGDIFMFSKLGCNNPIFAAIEDDYNSHKAFGVHMEWTDSAFPPNQRPLSVLFGLRNVKYCSIVGRNVGLGDFM